MPLGWHFADLEAENGSARFWLDSDRFGARAIEVQLTPSCSTEGATEIPSDRDRMRRLPTGFVRRTSTRLSVRSI